MHYTQDPKVLAAARAYIEMDPTVDDVTMVTSQLTDVLVEHVESWRLPVSFLAGPAHSPHTDQPCAAIRVLDRMGEMALDMIYVEDRPRRPDRYSVMHISQETIDQWLAAGISVKLVRVRGGYTVRIS